jgi:bacterial/archaeal transporter family protein
MSWIVYAVLSALAAGVTAVFAKAGLAEVPSQLANAIRTFMVLLMAIAIAGASGEHRALSTLSGRAWLFLTLSAVATAASWMAYFKALSLGPATPVTAIDKTSLAVTLVLAVAFLGEAWTWRSALGATLVIIGAFLSATK